LSSSAPDGFVVFSHAEDDFALCRDQVRRRLGIEAFAWKTKTRASARQQQRQERPDPNDRRADALALWREEVDPRGTLVEKYLASRRLERLGGDVAAHVLRWHPGAGVMLGSATMPNNLEAAREMEPSARDTLS
jgi:hypothetical protein